jgi:hypothetical protein
VRKGRKAAGLEEKMAELPKDEPFGNLGLFILNRGEFLI